MERKIEVGKIPAPTESKLYCTHGDSRKIIRCSSIEGIRFCKVETALDQTCVPDSGDEKDNYLRLLKVLKGLHEPK